MYTKYFYIGGAATPSVSYFTKSSSSRIITKKEKNIIETDKLNIDSFKSKKKLNWKTTLSVNESLDLTVGWYVAHYNKNDMSKFTQDQIKNFLNNINK